jgi:hypothetical protein
LKRLLTSMLLVPVFNLGSFIYHCGRLKRIPLTRLSDSVILHSLGKMLAEEFAKILLNQVDSSTDISILQDVNGSKVLDQVGDQIGFSTNPAHSAIVIRLLREVIISTVVMDLKNRSLLFYFSADVSEGSFSLSQLVDFLHGRGSLPGLSPQIQLAITKTAKMTPVYPWVEDSLFVYFDKSEVGDDPASLSNPPLHSKRDSSHIPDPPSGAISKKQAPSLV